MTKYETILKDFDISDGAMMLFLTIAGDAGNWGGQPLLPELSAQGKGFLTDLKKKGFLSTFTDEGCQWVDFEDKGRDLAKLLNIELQ